MQVQENSVNMRNLHLKIIYFNFVFNILEIMERKNYCTDQPLFSLSLNNYKTFVFYILDKCIL